MKAYIISLVVVGFALGCHEPILIDTTPPTPPKGIVAVARDNAVELSWLRNAEPDVAGYNVWICDRYDGQYQRIGATTNVWFIDYDAENGVRSYYGITAYDFEGNESDISSDVVYATPRPEGYGVRISDYRTSPNTAGYDFSTFSVGKFDDDYTDVFFEYYNERFYLDVWDDTDIQDMGYTQSLHEIAVAPSAGWVPSKSVEAVVGHTYVVWTWDDHYAKIRVREVTPSRLVFDWAYQTAKTNPELKRQPTNSGERGRRQRNVSDLRN